MMRRIYFLAFLFLYTCGFSQAVNLFNPANNQVYPDQLYFCSGENFDLKVDAVASSTGDYKITKEAQSAYPQLTAGSSPIIFPGAGADKFSNAFPIGFTFSFYGKDYTKVVAGSNGRLVFTNDAKLDLLNDATTYEDRTFSGIAGQNTYSKLPSKDYNKVYKNVSNQELNLSQIFFGYTDLVPQSQNSSVKYLYRQLTIGGQKALLVSFQNQIRRDRTGGISSTGYNSFILLFEDGKIVMDVRNKTETSYNAILGLQNDDASKFKVPPHSNTAYDYNNGKWNSENVVWVFTPNQNLTPQFKWLRNGAEISGQTSNTFQTTALSPALANNDKVRVEVTYLDDTGSPVGAVVSDEILFKSLPKPIITANSGGGCVAGITLTTTADPDLVFEWFNVANPTVVLGTGNSFYATQSGNFIVRASRKFSHGCSVNSDPYVVNLSSTIPPFNQDNHPFDFCDTNAAPTNTINLYDYYPSGANYTVVFSEGGAVITNPASFVLNANSVRTININVNDPTSGCSIDHNFSLRFDSMPNAVVLSKNFCFGTNSVDVSQYKQEISGANFADFGYLYSTDGSNFSSSSIINPKTNPKVWVKVFPLNNPASTCFTVSEINFTEDAKVIANTPTTQLPPQCANATETFDLASLIPEINPGNVTVTFHRSLGEAQSGQNAVAYNFRGGLDYTTLYIRVEDNATHCVSPDHPAITLLVYYKPTLIKNTIEKTNCEGNTIFNLTQVASDLTNAQPSITVTLEYYDQNGTQLTTAQIASYDATAGGLKPYIKVIYNPTCSDVVTFDLRYNPKPKSLVSQIMICSESSYSLQNFKDKVISNSGQYTFTDASGDPLPQSFDVSILPKVVQFYIEENATACLSDLQTVTFIKGNNTVLTTHETDYLLCDTDFDGKTAFDLDSKKLVFTSDTSATFEYFKNAAFTQSISANYTNEIAFAQTVYVKISVPNFCPSYGKINLKVNVPTKSSTLTDKYFICYGETITLDAGLENVSWEWSTGENTRAIQINEAGSYSVKLTNANGCSYTHNFTVSDENQPKIEVINQTNNSIEVIANGGAKPYTYYFNGVAQSSNILYNPTAASYEIQVKSNSGCLGPPKTVYFIKINNAFSPNGDGINDAWRIENLDKMQEVSIIITDRLGNKVFESNNPTTVEWDGKLNGRALPTATYWYVATWYDAVTQKREQRQGWILLKNRN